jgi:hypothetical protein
MNAELADEIPASRREHLKAVMPLVELTRRSDMVDVTREDAEAMASDLREEKLFVCHEAAEIIDRLSTMAFRTLSPTADAELVKRLDIDAIEARVNAATKGPWSPSGVAHMLLGGECLNPLTDDQAELDGLFIAHGRSDVPAMIEEIRRLRAALASARREAIEECAATAANSYIIGGTHIGPLYNAGWGGACKHISDVLRSLTNQQTPEKDGTGSLPVDPGEDPTPFPDHSISTEKFHDGRGLGCNKCTARGAELAHPCKGDAP